MDPKESRMKLVFYSQTDPFGLCASYMRSADQLGLTYRFFDYTVALRKYMPFGKLGFKFQQYLFIETLNHKINREFVIDVKTFQPQAILFFTNAPVSAAALIFIKSILPDCRLILIWPDSLLNITQLSMHNLQLYDYIGTYSSTSVNILQKLTNARVSFIPLGGDPEIHFKEPAKQTQIDFGFVGGWRPEREKALSLIAENFPDRSMQIHGPYWKEKCNNILLKSKIKGQGLHGKAMADFFNQTKINLNIIDDTNYPAANMRFFEILMAGGLELASACPEMEHIFKHKEDLFYYKDEASLLENVSEIFTDESTLQGICQNGHQKVINNHTYLHRLSTVLKEAL